MGILLGYTDIEYCVFLNDEVIATRHVDWIGEDIICIDCDDEYEKN